MSDASDLPDPAETERACTCTPPPSYEGPCAWCNVHGQPSVAFEQGLRQGEHSAKVVHAMEIRDLSTALRAMAARSCYWRHEAKRRAE